MINFYLHISFKPLISILNLKRILIRPVRDDIWVEIMDSPNAHRAVRCGIYKKPDTDAKHIAYQLVVGHCLRHAVLCLHSVFYRYVVPRLDRDLPPTGQFSLSIREIP